MYASFPIVIVNKLLIIVKQFITILNKFDLILNVIDFFFFFNMCRLQAQQEEIWGNLVTIVSSDMREWNPPELADILVSELLGSFGDNELSPECLDGAQKVLKGLL